MSSENLANSPVAPLTPTADSPATSPAANAPSDVNGGGSATMPDGASAAAQTGADTDAQSRDGGGLSAGVSHDAGSDGVAASSPAAAPSGSDERSGDDAAGVSDVSATAPNRAAGSADIEAATQNDSASADAAQSGAGSADIEAATQNDSADPHGAGTVGSAMPAAANAEGDAEVVDAHAAEADGTSTAAPGEAKKRRRRRKKKKKGDAEGEKASAGERAPFHTGEEVFGRVTAVLPEAVMVDLSGKALGIFDRQEMEPDDLVPAEGDRFLARVHHGGTRGGLVVLTRKPLREEAARPIVEAAHREGSLVQGLVTGVIKGGVDVDIQGLRAFAPASGMDLHPQNANFASLVGQRMDFKVTQYDNNGRDVVVTRRPMLEAEAHERRKKALTLLKPEQVMTGVVRTIVEWGVFVALPDAENLEGLVHVSEATHDPRARLAEVFKPGERFDVKITRIDDKGKIWLSRKALIPDPWKEAKEKYPPGAQFKTTVTRVEAFGAFCQLEGLEGLIHVTDLSPTRVEHANEVIHVGDEIDVVVHQFDLRNHKVALHPALTGDRAGEQRQRVARNAALDVEVVRAESAGLQVRVKGATGRAARGFIPAGQTGTQRGTDLRKHFPVGTALKAAVIDIDPRRGEPKLSIRRFHENEERNAHREYRKQLAQEGGFGTLGDLLRKSLSR